METLFAWLHLADIHLRFGPADSSDPALIRERLIEDASRLVQGAVQPEAILVTGDLAFDGRVYADVDAWLGRLATALGRGPGDVYMVPGNHDVDREADRDRSVSRLVQSLREGHDALDVALEDLGDRALLARRLQFYLSSATQTSGASLYWHRIRPGRRCPIRLVGLNTALLATSDDDRGKLRVGAEQLSMLSAPNGELVLALMHHPPDGGWLADEKVVAAALSAHAHVTLAGQAHEPVMTVPGYKGPTVIAGTSLDGDRTAFSYNMGAILADDDGTLMLRLWPRRWSSKIKDFRTDVESVPDGQLSLNTHVSGKLQEGGPTKPSLVAGSTQESTVSAIPDIDRRAAYLTSVDIDNIRSIRSLHWRAPSSPGWHVIIGDNGSGKSTVLRCIGVALLVERQGPRRPDPDTYIALRIDFGTWVRANETFGRIAITAEDPEGVPAGKMSSVAELHRGAASFDVEGSAHACFTAGFGPFRRFAGGDPDYERQFTSLPRVTRHLSLFDERTSMTNSLRWLMDLQFKALADASNASFLERLKAFINQDCFLPNKVTFHHITPDAVVFRDATGADVSIEDLSDGYRSILSLTIELIRQLATHYSADQIFDLDSRVIIVPGIVLIDEADAHLHPTWQREIGVRLKKLFPRIQFIVTTHSPLVCQAADSVFRLPRPGTDEEGRLLEGVELDRLRFGNVLDAYGTGVFGRITRSEEGQEMLERLADLDRKEIEEGLNAPEEQEQEHLRAIFPTGRAAREARR